MSCYRMSEEEKKYLERYDISEYERPSVATDMAIFSVMEAAEAENFRKLPKKSLKLLLVCREAYPYKGSWALPGGFCRPGEDVAETARRELFEETGIRAAEEEFELLESVRDGNIHFDHYCIQRDTPLSEVVLLPGETDDVQWATFQQVKEMIAEKKMCRIIARQFKRQEQMLLSKQNIQKNP